MVPAMYPVMICLDAGNSVRAAPIQYPCTTRMACRCENIVLVSNDDEKADETAGLMRLIVSNDNGIAREELARVAGKRGKTRRASMGIRDCDKAASVALGDDVYDIVCKVCGDRFRVKACGEVCLCQKKDPVSPKLTKGSLMTRLPLPLRRFMNFDSKTLRKTCHWGEEDVNEAEMESCERGSGVVGSLREVMLMPFFSSGCQPL